MKPLLKNYNSAGVMGRFIDRMDGTSSQRLLGWTVDVSSSMATNLRYLSRLHDPLQVSNCFSLEDFMPQKIEGSKSL